jgi:hypothetical protein
MTSIGKEGKERGVRDEDKYFTVLINPLGTYESYMGNILFIKYFPYTFGMLES